MMSEQPGKGLQGGYGGNNFETVVLLDKARNDAIHGITGEIRLHHPHVYIATPGPAGLIAFGMTTTMNMLITAGAVNSDARQLVAAYALWHGGFLQLIAAMWAFSKGDAFGATAFSTYGMFWISNSTYVILTNWFNWTPNREGLSFFLAIYALFTILMFVGTLVLNRGLQVVFSTLAATFILLSAGEFHAGTLRAAGVVGTICGLSAIFVGWAELMNAMHGREIIPLGHCKVPFADDCERRGTVDSDHHE